MFAAKSAAKWAPVALCAVAYAGAGPFSLNLALGQESKAVSAQAPTGAVAAPGPGAPAPGSPGASATPGDAAAAAGASPGAKPGEGDPSKPAGPVQRPSAPPTPADPGELKVKPDSAGLVSFSFRNQSWPGVLQWLAEVSGMSLDWQELPGDYINLATQRPYKVEEARDLINRHLLARSFTLLEQDGVLSVVSIAKLNPGMVPRVQPEELASRQPHEFVKVSFPLDWMVAETAVEELKPMLSPHGKLTALKSTNRVDAMDTVINLREIHLLLSQEQSGNSQERLVREFVLKHARAADVKTQLETLLGVEKKDTGPLTPEQMQQQMQQQQMRMQQMQQAGGAAAAKPQEKTEVNLVVNSTRNSILAHASPDKIAVVEQAVRVLDVPAEQGGALLTNINRMQVYRLVSLDPEPLARTLQEIGGLDPTSRLEVDKKNRAIIAYAALADHVTIRTIISKLDGSGRQFEVIPLRRLPADYIAGSIEFMMGSAEPEKENNRRSSYYYDYGFFGGRNNEEKAKEDKFRVDADTENNRLLLWANEIELEEVRNLLVKLGEIPPRDSQGNTMRVLSLPEAQADEILEKARQAWPSVAPNPLVAPPAPAQQSQPPVDVQPDVPGTELPTQLETPANVDVTTAGTAPASAPTVRPLPATFASAPSTEAQTDSAKTNAKPFANAAAPQSFPSFEKSSPTQTPPPGRSSADPAGAPPVSIQRGEDGRVIISSQDAEALNLLEDLLDDLSPARKDYRVFQLKHASAYWIAMNLEDFFGTDKKKEDENSRFARFYWGFPDSPSENSDGRNRLSKRQPLKFISDLDSNTILVSGGDPSQLQTIEELIEIYDRPESPDAQSARVTGVFHIRYSKASTIAEVIKDVYRDLLSNNDKALAKDDQQQKQRPEAQNTYITNVGGSGEGEDKKTRVSFKGKISIGIDDVSNTLIVSTEGENLLITITKMIETLDEAAAPLSTVRVLKIGGGVNAGEVRGSLARVLGSSAVSGSSSATPAAPAGGNPGAIGAAPAGNGAATNSAAPGTTQ